VFNDGQATISSCVVYCDCDLHETLSILFVKCEFNGKETKYVLPGGKRDASGREGRAKN